MRKGRTPSYLPKIGEFFGSIEVRSEPFLENSRRKVLCECSCGKEFTVKINSLLTGNTTSCGCSRKERLRERNYKHGLAGRTERSPEYRSWANMIQRCTNPKNKRYKDNGARGIQVCEEWKNFLSFLKDLGPKPTKKHTIERINNNGNYEPGNCCWATNKEQSYNKRNNRFITFNNETLTLKQWSEKLKVNISTLHQRLSKLTIEEAFRKYITGDK